MIEDIQALRQAARLTPDNENQDEKVWRRAGRKC